MYRPWYIVKGQALFTLILLLSAICGLDATLTDAIFHGQTEVLVTPGLVRKEGLTLDTCASACVAEKTIKCQYFKFINNTKTCYLSETDHPSTKHVINKVTKPGGIKPASNSSTKLEQSIDRLKNVREKIENLEESDDAKASEVKALKKQSLKQVRAIVNLDSRVNSLHSQVSDVGTDVLDLEKSQRTIAKNLQLLRSSTGNLGLNIKRLTHLAGDLQSDVEDVKIFNSSILRQLAKVSHSNKDLDRKLSRLSTYLHDKRVFNPDDIQHTQLRISAGMSTLARSQKSFWHQLRDLEHTVDMMTTTIGRESKGTGEVHKAILNLQSSIHNIKIAMAKFSDPMSFQNRRWQRDVDGLKHILVKLAGTNSRLDEEMTGNRREVAMVIKDLTNVQMAVQSLKSNIDGVRSKNAELVESVQELLKAKSKIPSILEMTKISTTILKSLSAIDGKERTLKSRMEQLGDSMSNLEKRMQTKDNDNKLDKYALQQLSKHVKTLADDMQRINTFVVKIDKNQPSAETTKKNGVVQRKLVSVVNQLQRKMVDMNILMKHYQNSAQIYADRIAKTLISKSTSEWATSLKELKSDLKELRQQDKSTKQKLDKLENTVATLGKLDPTLNKCPMGTLQIGHRCIPVKIPGKKPPEEKRKEEKGKKKEIKEKKETKGKKKPTIGKKGTKKHVKETKGKKKQPKLKCPIGTILKGRMCIYAKKSEKKKHVKGAKKDVKGTKTHIKATKGKKKHVKGAKKDVKGTKTHIKATKGKKKQPKIKCPMGTILKGGVCIPAKKSGNKKQVKGTKENVKGTKKHVKPTKLVKGTKKDVKGTKTYIKGTEGKKKQPKIRCPMGTILKGGFCIPAKIFGKKKHVIGARKDVKGTKTHIKGTEGKKKQPKIKCPKGTIEKGGMCIPAKKSVVKKHLKGMKAKKKDVKETKEKKHVKETEEKKKHEKETEKKKHEKETEKKKHVKRKQRRRHFRAREGRRRGRRELHGVDSRAVRIKRETDPDTKQPVAEANKKGPLCPSGYQLVDKYCFLYLPKPQTYHMATLQCKKHQGEVPEVASREMQQALKIFLLAVTRAEVPSVWLSSMTFNTEAKKWHWEGSDDSILYENYMMDRPAGREGKMCNQYRIEWDSHWSASPCNEDTKLPTVCHRHIDHVPSTEFLL